MNIERIDKNKVLIDLCDKEMERLSIEYSTLHIPQNKPVIKAFIELAKAKTGINTYPHSKIRIEAMPYEGGCFLLITLKYPNLFVGKKFRIVRKVFERIFLFGTSNDMIQAIQKLYGDGNFRYQSRLILYREHYCLLIESCVGIDKKSVHILEEYACQIYTQTIRIAHIKEHGTTIVLQNAVEIIGKNFYLCG